MIINFFTLPESSATRLRLITVARQLIGEFLFVLTERKTIFEEDLERNLLNSSGSDDYVKKDGKSFHRTYRSSGRLPFESILSPLALVDH